MEGFDGDKIMGGQRNDAVTESTGSSSRGLEDWAQFPAPTWKLTTTCSSMSRVSDRLDMKLHHQAHTWCTDIHEGKIPPSDIR